MYTCVLAVCLITEEFEDIKPSTEVSGPQTFALVSEDDVNACMGIMFVEGREFREGNLMFCPYIVIVVIKFIRVRLQLLNLN